MQDIGTCCTPSLGDSSFGTFKGEFRFNVFFFFSRSNPHRSWGRLTLTLTLTLRLSLNQSLIVHLSLSLTLNPPRTREGLRKVKLPDWMPDDSTDHCMNPCCEANQHTPTSTLALTRGPDRWR